MREKVFVLKVMKCVQDKFLNLNLFNVNTIQLQVYKVGCFITLWVLCA